MGIASVQVAVRYTEMTVRPDLLAPLATPERETVVLADGDHIQAVRKNDNVVDYRIMSSQYLHLQVALGIPQPERLVCGPGEDEFLVFRYTGASYST